MMPLLVVASLWYMLIVSLMTALQYFIEARLLNGPA